MVKNIIKLVEDLVKNPKIELVEENLEFVNFKLRKNSYLETGGKIKEQFGVDLSKDELQIEGFQIKWKKPNFKDFLGNVYGGFSLSIYNGLYAPQKEWLNENPLNHPQELVDNLYSFNDSEVQLHTPQKGRGCFYREHGKWPLDIYFFDKGVRIKMDMSLENYIQALIDSCAVGYWQYFYVDIDEIIKQNRELTLRDATFYNEPDKRDLDSPKLKYLLYELDILATNLPILFPEKDFSYHQNRLSQIKEKAQPYL
jgi:hypothetical protein